MLDRVDRIQMAVAEATPVARAFQDILGAELAREDESDYLNAHRTIVALGASEVELCAPRGAGVVRAHLDRWGPGLLTAGFSVASVPALRAHLISEDVVSDWTAAAERYTRLFGLDPARFSPIHSDRFGYTGTLTLFDPPGRLDRIEISQVTDPKSPSAATTPASPRAAAILSPSGTGSGSTHALRPAARHLPRHGGSGRPELVAH
jgi:hypothetical protein